MDKKDIPFTYCWTSPCGEHIKREEALRARVAELEAALRDALGSFKCTQRVLSYPESHWSSRACALLNEEPEQPGYITFTRP